MARKVRRQACRIHGFYRDEQGCPVCWFNEQDNKRLRQEQAELLRQWKLAEEEREKQDAEKRNQLATQQLLQMQRMKYREVEVARLRQQQQEEEARRKAESEQRQRSELLSAQASLEVIESQARQGVEAAKTSATASSLKMVGLEEGIRLSCLLHSW